MNLILITRKGLAVKPSLSLELTTTEILLPARFLRANTKLVANLLQTLVSLASMDPKIQGTTL